MYLVQNEPFICPYKPIFLLYIYICESTPQGDRRYAPYECPLVLVLDFQFSILGYSCFYNLDIDFMCIKVHREGTFFQMLILIYDNQDIAKYG